MKKQISLIILYVLIITNILMAEIITWDASMGILPSDISIPPEHRFELHGEISFVSIEDGFININDDSNPLQVGFIKTDIPIISSEQDWAFEVNVRMNSHSREATMDWGTYLGIVDSNKSILLTIADDKVGFMSADRNSFVNNSSVTFNTTGSFHSYRIAKKDGMVNLYFDENSSAALSIPYHMFGLWTGSTNIVLFPVSSSIGTANYDVANFVYNLEAAEIPEPTALLLFGIGSMILLRRKDKVNL